MNSEGFMAGWAKAYFRGSYNSGAGKETVEAYKKVTVW